MERGGIGTLFWMGLALDSSWRQVFFISSMPFYYYKASLIHKDNGFSQYTLWGQNRVKAVNSLCFNPFICCYKINK